MEFKDFEYPHEYYEALLKRNRVKNAKAKEEANKNTYKQLELYINSLGH